MMIRVATAAILAMLLTQVTGCCALLLPGEVAMNILLNAPAPNERRVWVDDTDVRRPLAQGPVLTDADLEPVSSSFRQEIAPPEDDETPQYGPWRAPEESEEPKPPGPPVPQVADTEAPN
jgi:hypothetical protein